MLKNAIRAARSRFRELAGVQAVLRPVAHSLPLVRLGSNYGGWWLVDDPTLRGSTIISAGLGKDATFDLAFADRYDAKVIAIDPTPDAISFFKTLTDSRLSLVEKALWHEHGRVAFYPPRDATHVSHSIVNLQRTEAPSFEADTVTMADLPLPTLLKLDIEGAQIEVLCDMMLKGIRPAQILVEYDEMNFPCRLSRERVETAHNALSTNGYRLLKIEGANCLYALRSH